MKRLIFSFLIILFILNAGAQEHVARNKVVRGFDGGMMVHAGYMTGKIAPLDYKADGVTVGLGGVLRMHLGDHWMVGGEGYVSTLHQLKNGSYLKWGWGGLLGEFYWTFNKVMPYLGVTVGGGSLTTYLMFDGDAHDWQPESDAVFNKQTFLAVTPFVGCDFMVSKLLHLTLKVDCLHSIGKTGLLMPLGPRLYFGCIFFH